MVRSTGPGWHGVRGSVSGTQARMLLCPRRSAKAQHEGGEVMSERKQEIQAEIEALNAVLSALAPLDEETRRLILGYVQQRFGSGQLLQAPVTPPSPPEATLVPPTPTPPPAEEFVDIRTFKERKRPANAVEMAVLVAHYLSEIAPDSERMGTIGTDEITKYFNQADYRASGQPRVILHRAKNAGYLDSAERGQYRLNPVGRNLATQGLPRPESSSKSTAKSTRTRKRPSAKRKAAASKKRTGAKKPASGRSKSARSR